MGQHLLSKTLPTPTPNRASYTVDLQAIVCSDTLIYRQTVVVMGLNTNS